MTVPQDAERWRKATRSQNDGACVELHPDGAVRDSKNPAGPVLEIGYAGLVRAVQAGHLTPLTR